MSETTTTKIAFSRRESADFLGVSERQLDIWIAGKKIAATRLGRLIRIHRDELDRVLRDGIS